jgi:hypothetical protein
MVNLISAFSVRESCDAFLQCGYERVDRFLCRVIAKGDADGGIRFAFGETEGFQNVSGMTTV